MTEPLRIRPTSGMCSRLRVIVGAMAQAEAEGRPLQVWWDWRAGANLSSQMPIHLREVLDSPCSYEQGEPDDYLETCHLEPFAPYIREGRFCEQFQRLHPMPRLSAYVAEMASQLHGPVVGVYIRRAERHQNMASVAWFKQRLRAFLGSYPDYTVYLSADMPEVSEAIRAEVPGVIEQPKSYVYDAEGAVKHFADLYVLIEHCDYVIATNNSASSQVVALARGATYKGPSHKRGGIIGGNYEDAWNPGGM